MEQNKEIAKLLRLYFRGMTTSEEERQLTEYFAGNDVPPDMSAIKEMFAIWAKAAKDTCPTHTASTIDALCGAVKETPPASKLTRRIYPWLLGMAAAASLALMLLLIPGKNDPEIYCYLNGKPVTDMEVAGRQAAMAVNLLSDGFAATKKSFDTVEGARQTLGTLVAVVNILRNAGEVDRHEGDTADISTYIPQPPSRE